MQGSQQGRGGEFHRSDTKTGYAVLQINMARKRDGDLCGGDVRGRYAELVNCGPDSLEVLRLVKSLGVLRLIAANLHARLKSIAGIFSTVFKIYENSDDSSDISCIIPI